MTDLKIDVNEISYLLKAIEIAINRKVYTKQEINEYFPLWNNLTASIEKIKRQTIVDKMYEEPVSAPVPAPATVPVVEPASAPVAEETKVINV